MILAKRARSGACSSNQLPLLRSWVRVGLIPPELRHRERHRPGQLRDVPHVVHEHKGGELVRHVLLGAGCRHLQLADHEMTELMRQDAHRGAQHVGRQRVELRHRPTPRVGRGRRGGGWRRHPIVIACHRAGPPGYPVVAARLRDHLLPKREVPEGEATGSDRHDAHGPARGGLPVGHHVEPEDLDTVGEHHRRVALLAHLEQLALGMGPTRNWHAPQLDEAGLLPRIDHHVLVGRHDERRPTREIVPHVVDQAGRGRAHASRLHPNARRAPRRAIALPGRRIETYRSSIVRVAQHQPAALQYQRPGARGAQRDRRPQRPHDRPKILRRRSARQQPGQGRRSQESKQPCPRHGTLQSGKSGHHFQLPRHPTFPKLPQHA